MTLVDMSPSSVRSLKHLVCTRCSGSMDPGTESLTCGKCGTTYPVDENGIVRVLPKAPARMNPAVRMGQWNWVAAVYDRFWRTRAMTFLTGEMFPPERETDIVADSIGLKRGSLFLDNACANGFYARRIAQRLIRDGQEGVVFAVDASMPMLRIAQRLARNEGVADRIVFVHADAEQLPFADGLFDGIMCGGSLNEFTAPDQVLRELRRVLEPGNGNLSMMFQVRAQRGVKAAAQWLSSRLLGLRILNLRDSIEMVRSVLEPEIRFYGGMVLMLRCTSRIQTIEYQPILRFTAPVAAA